MTCIYQFPDRCLRHQSVSYQTTRTQSGSHFCTRPCRRQGSSHVGEGILSAGQRVGQWGLERGAREVGRGGCGKTESAGGVTSFTGTNRYHWYAASDLRRRHPPDASSSILASFCTTETACIVRNVTQVPRPSHRPVRADPDLIHLLSIYHRSASARHKRSPCPNSRGALGLWSLPVGAFTPCHITVAPQRHASVQTRAVSTHEHRHTSGMIVIRDVAATAPAERWNGSSSSRWPLLLA